MTSVLPALSPELRASLPAERRGLRRDRVRLMVIDRGSRRIEHARFDDIGQWLRRGDLLVVNTSRTLPGAIIALRDDGTAVQLRPCVRRHDADGEEWDALSVAPDPPHNNVPLRGGDRLRIADAEAVVVGRRDDIPYLWRIRVGADGVRLLAAHGEPIRYSYVPERVEPDHYQTVYAARPGSVEPPSAGRPFSWELLGRLRRAGVGIAEIVLHTGLSSFQDDDFDAEHHMFEEWAEVPETTVDMIRDLRRSRDGDRHGPRTVAVGTTVVRALESAARGGVLVPYRGWTDLVIRPGHTMRAVDGLITGFHEPQASHFDLLLAFVDEPLLARAYAEAVTRRYLWHEFGDATLIV